MHYLYIASTTGYSGKSLITLGLGLMLKDRGLSIGYIKPYGKTPLEQNGRIVDADAEFLRKALDISEPAEVVSPFVVTYELQNNLLKGRPSDKFDAVNKAVSSIADKDVLLVNGAADLYEGITFGVNDLRLIRHLKAKTLVVEPWNGDSTIDAIVGAKDLLGPDLIGTVINRVPQSVHDHVRDSVRPFLENKGIAVFGAVLNDVLLNAITVRQLNDILGGRVLCCEEGLDEFIESFSIGAMDVDSALKYFRRTPNKAVITGAHRSDIQLAALETSTRCIILTGGLYTNDVIIGKAKMTNTPIISVHDDTFATVQKIESVIGKIKIREQEKVRKIKEVMEKEFDIARLLKELQDR